MKRLTPSELALRERIILFDIVTGINAKRTADKLRLRPKRVYAMRAKLKRRLGCSDFRELPGAAEYDSWKQQPLAGDPRAVNVCEQEGVAQRELASPSAKGGGLADPAERESAALEKIT